MFSDTHQTTIKILKFATTQIYVGECKKKSDGSFTREGRGVHIVSENERRDGFWSGDQLNGQGRIIQSSGHVYHGRLLNDQRSGKGTSKNVISGDWYDGDWLND